MPIIKDATVGQAPVAWVGWFFGIFAVALGLVRPIHWGLLVIGIGLLVGMSIALVLRIREHAAARRMARRP